jgi:hypothetical protein
MVRLSITLTAGSPRGTESLIEGLRYQMASTELERGCLGCGAWTAVDYTVHYFEDWESESAVRRRVLSDRFTSLLAVVESASKAHVQFDFVTDTRGLEYVFEVREQAT